MQDEALTTLLWRRWRLIAISIVICLAAAAAITLLQEKEYEGTALLQVASPNQPAGNATDLANQGLAKGYATVITSRSFLERVQPRIAGGSLSVKELENTITADAVVETSLLRVHANAESPDEARRIVGDVAEAFLATLRRDASRQVISQQAEINRVIRTLTDQIEELESAGATAAADQLRSARGELSKQSAVFVTNSVAQGGSVSLAAPPSASSNPVRPRPVVNGLAALVLGSLLGVGLVWLRERVSPTVYSADEAATALNLPVLGSVPLRRRPSSNDPAIMEAFGLLWANLGFRMRGDSMRVLAFVSYSPSTGKTTTVEQLAAAAIRAGRSVAMVDADLRSGSLSHRLGHPHHIGMARLLEDGLDVSEVAIEIKPNLVLVPAEAPVENPTSLLHGPRLRELFTDLAQRFDIVLVDTPPISRLADGLILASVADAVVLVARSEANRPDDLRAAVSSVERSGTPVLGLVMFEHGADTTAYYPATSGRRRRADRVEAR